MTLQDDTDIQERQTGCPVSRIGAAFTPLDGITRSTLGRRWPPHGPRSRSSQVCGNV